MMNRARFYVFATAVTTSILLSGGCGSVHSKAVKVPSAPPASRSQTPSDSQGGQGVPERPAPEASKPTPAQVDEAIRESRSLYEVGISHYERGEMDQARHSFDRAIERLTSGPGGAKADERLSDAYTDLIRSIREVEISSYESGAGLSREEPAPLNLLDEIEPEITPEEAARERELLAGAEVVSDLPIVLNDRVLAWIEIFQGRLHDKCQEALTRSGRYIDMIRRIFREEGLPEDLVYMAHVESAYKPYAYSRARAKGVWQFIASTGSRYGLRRDHWIDERSDPELATRAAAAYLKDLYAMFGDWYLAMAAYNAGEGRIQRAIARTGQTDFWSIARTSQIRLETKNYVPAILAATVISKDPERFGFSNVKEPAVVYETVPISGPTDLGVIANLAGTSVETLRELNPALTRLMTPPNYPDFDLRLPAGTAEVFSPAYAALPASARIPWKAHTVRKGETLAGISRRYGVTVSQVRQANGLSSNATIKTGITLQIPTYWAPPAAGHADVTQASSRSSPGRGTNVVHRVRRGETLSSIARKYRTSVQEIRRLNRLSSTTIHAGTRLVIRSGGPPRDQRPAARGEDKTTKIARAGSASSPGTGRQPGSDATYTVRYGDTLFKIAERMATSVEQICRLNAISSSAPIHPGTVLKVR